MYQFQYHLIYTKEHKHIKASQLCCTLQKNIGMQIFIVFLENCLQSALLKW